MESIWIEYDVTWNFLSYLCGQTPADPEIIGPWLEARQPKVKPPEGKSMEEINAEVMDTIERAEEEQFSKLVFQRVDGHLVMRAATVRAHLKDCARVLSAQYVARIQGERAFSTRVINGVYLDERKYWIPVLSQDTGRPITAIDGEKEKPVHAKGPRGQPINCLKCFEYVNNARMKFRLKVLGRQGSSGSVSERDLEILLQYGGTHGYGGERSEDGGRYIFEIERITPREKRQSGNKSVQSKGSGNKNA